MRILPLTALTLCLSALFACSSGGGSGEAVEGLAGPNQVSVVTADDSDFVRGGILHFDVEWN